MRSQVQVLAGPPTIIAAQSTAGSEPGALAAGLGRAGAARPSPPTPPVAPPGPPTRPSGSATTTQRGRAPQPEDASHAAGADTSRRPGLPGRSAGKRGRRGPHPTRPARVRHRPPTDRRDLGSVAGVPASSTVVEPSTARQPPGPPPVPVVRVARPARPDPHRHRLSMGGDGRVRTDGWTSDGWTRTGGQQTAERRTLRTTTSPGDRTADGWTAGSRTPNPDGWTPPAGHRRPTPWRACWPCRPRRRRPSARDRLDAPAGRRRLLGEQPPGPRSSKDAEGTHAATDGSGHRRDVSCRWYAAVQLAPSHCCPQTISGRA
jgi:hypothetical protein